MAQGDHIKAIRPHFWVTAGMEHHGIDLGDGTVIHYAMCEALPTPPKDQHMVVRTNIKAFCKNAEAEVVDYQKYQGFWEEFYKSYRYRKELDSYLTTPERNAEEVVALAVENLGRGRDNYHLGGNNCEHFATLMKRGVPYSMQVMRFDDNSITARDGGLTTLVMEGLRVFGSRMSPSKGTDLAYKASVYQSSDMFYGEFYNDTLALPPEWYVSKDISGPWNSINQSELPNPLENPLHEFLATFVGKNGDLVSVDYKGNTQRGGWFP